MKKIAFVATAYIKNYDGISVYTENLLLEFLKQIQDQDISVDIYTGSSVIELLKNRISKENLLNEKISIKSVNDSKFISKILDLNFQLIKNAKYDLIFMSNFMPTVFLASKTLKVIHDFSVNNFSELYSKGYLKYHNMLLSYAKYFDHAIGYISNTTLADLNKFHKINPSNKKLLHLQNGIPFKVKNYERPSDEQSLEKYKKRDLSFLVVGRINKHKGFDRILEFCEYFDKTENINSFDSVTLNIVGKQTDETTQIFKDLNLQNIKLVFHGFLSDEDLNPLYIKSHFCLFLSRNEGYGIPLVEAMWFKSIPIISNIPIFDEIMTNEYPKFDDKTNYTSSIVEFVNKIFDDITYLKKQKEFIETIVLNEQTGYEKAAKNLVKFIEKL
ncbi:MAG: glycosyltransferase [Aliarcobacter sp.]|nr:glycosyltransferase [Aliarcobacter sp.]MBP7225993.1 glycosyltransferase [Aliarcobacter sp.]